MKEDKLIPALIDLNEPRQFEIDEADDGVDYVSKPEVHYNHYGTRGCVDLLNRKKYSINGKPRVEDALYEIKSDSAVEQATGANEIIRQYNKMRTYFYKSNPVKNLIMPKFELVFIPTKKTVAHVIENAELYEAASSHTVNEGMDLPTETIAFRTPNKNDHAPVSVYRSSAHPGFSEPFELMESLSELAEYNGECYQRVHDLIAEVVDDVDINSELEQ